MIFFSHHLQRQGIMGFNNRVCDLFKFRKHGLPEKRRPDVVDFAVKKYSFIFGSSL